MFSTIRPYIILYILHGHTENTSLPNGPFIYSVGSWPGTKLWAIVRHQKYQHPHCLPAHPKDTTQWPDKTCISKTQPQSSKVFWACYHRIDSILSLMYLPLPSLFLLQLWVKQQLDCTLSQLSHDHLQGLVCCLPKIQQWKSHGEIRIRLCGLEFMLLSWTNLGSEAETLQFCEKYLLSLVVTLYIIGICLQYPFYLIFRSNIQQRYLTFDKNQ